MKIIAINGSPRMNHNTATILKEVVNGATFKGAEVEVINLYKLNYKGCISCMSCKRKNSKKPRTCVVKDDLTEVFEKIQSADAIVFASPIYFYDITGQIRCFLERLLYPYLPYDVSVKEGTYFPRPIKTAFIYTMGLPDGVVNDKLKIMEDFISQIFRTKIEIFSSNLCYPFLDDYNNYEASDLSSLVKRREEEFPSDCKKAFDFGVSLATN